MEVLRRSLIVIGEALGIRNLDPDCGLIFITGGTGVIGHRIAVKLLQSGYSQVRVAAHKLEHVQELRTLLVGAAATTITTTTTTTTTTTADAEKVVVDFSWNHEDSYARALKGVKTVICTIPHTEDWNKHFDAFLQACIKAGVKHFIKLSFCHARDATEQVLKNVPLIKSHGKCDQLLVSTLTPAVVQVALSGDVEVDVDYAPRMGYTILYSSFYMSNPLVQYHSELHRGENNGDNDNNDKGGGPMPLAAFYGASGNKPVNYVSPNDVAEVAVRVALEPCRHYDQEYTLTGSEVITDQQVAKLLEQHLQRPVQYVDQSFLEFERGLCAHGDAPWHIMDLVGLEKLKQVEVDKEGKPLIEPTDDIWKICQHQPQTFQEYLDAKDLMMPLERGPANTTTTTKL